AAATRRSGATPSSGRSGPGSTTAGNSSPRRVWRNTTSTAGRLATSSTPRAPSSSEPAGAWAVVVWFRHGGGVGRAAVSGGGRVGAAAAGGRVHLCVCRAHGGAGRVQGD